MLTACLESLAQNAGSEVPFEVIIVLNGSPEAVERFVLEDVTGATVVASTVNRGVAGGYNLGRRSAGGEFVVLLHDDVEVSPGWLEALVEAADETPEAGAVGSRALNPDGTLQSAGAIVRPDGTTELLKDDSPGRRPVDYCGSNSLLVRASTWDAVGGLDERFFPAYYVDVDLGMRIREFGQFVLCEPRSQLTHHRWGATTDLGFRVFAAQRNRERFVEKWQSSSRGALLEHSPSSDVDYLRLELGLRDAYIAELKSSRSFRLQQRLLPLFRLISRLAGPSRKE
jgi:GT2 family glycosyltransferase